MGRSISTETKARKAINMINQLDATWEEVADVVELSIVYLQKNSKKKV